VVRVGAGLLPDDRRRGRGGGPLEPLFRTHRPGIEPAARTPARQGEATQPEYGYLHCGPVGAGHFVKMVHNGIEYGLMAAYAEGLAVLNKANIGRHTQADDAETTPLRDPEYYQSTLTRPRSRRCGAGEVWSAAGSSTSPLTPCAGSPGWESFTGRVSDSGEGRWTVLAAVDEGVPAEVLHLGPLYPLLVAR